MSAVELKNKLKEKIEQISEDYLLEELLNIIELESSKTIKFEIPEQHKKGLQISLEQMDVGKTTAQEQVLKELRDGLSSISGQMKQKFNLRRF